MAKWCTACLMLVEQDDCPNGQTVEGCAFNITEAERQRRIRLHKRRSDKHVKRLTGRKGVKPRKKGRKLKCRPQICTATPDPNWSYIDEEEGPDG